MNLFQVHNQCMLDAPGVRAYSSTLALTQLVQVHEGVLIDQVIREVFGVLDAMRSQNMR